MMAETLTLSNQDKRLDLNELLKTRYKTLSFLDLSANNIADFNLKFNFINLQSLILDNNLIPSIANFPTMKRLETLSLNENKFNSAMEFAMYSVEKFPSIRVINTLRNPMNPGLEKYEEYVNYRAILRKIRTLRILDGFDLNDDKCLDIYKNRSVSGSNANKKNLFDFEEGNSKSIGTGGISKYNNDTSITNDNNPSRFTGEMAESEVANIIKLKKRQSTITYSQRMLKKADNLTKFNRKNHSEGNKHITNNDL